MPKTVSIAIDDLALDLRNYRTVAQPREAQAIQAMISVSPSRFWALVESLLEDGYLPTENIIVFKGGPGSPQTVREGNRRIAALKLIHGLTSKSSIAIPIELKNRIKGLTPEWKESNRAVPCLVFGPKEASAVDRLVTRAHGKGDKTSRDPWESIARARHNRDANQASEPGLDLLEKYFKNGRNLTKEQIDNWSGTYPISILDEAIKKIAPRIKLSSAPELAKKYPKIEHRDALDAIIKDVGLRNIKFETIRDPQRDFAAAYGILPLSVDPFSGGGTTSSDGNEPPKSQSNQGAPTSNTDTQNTNASNTKPTKNSAPENGNGTNPPLKKTIAVPINDPKAVMRTLRKFTPLGFNREKVVALKKEMLTLKLDKAPMAFCFLLRSTFEISAKCYCDDHKGSGGPSMKDSSGKDKRLVEVLKSIVTHLTQNKADKEKTKALHGAITELAKEEGLLSVTSMNQLVHNQKFSIIPGDLAALFGNVYPLLDAMNN